MEETAGKELYIRTVAINYRFILNLNVRKINKRDLKHRVGTEVDTSVAGHSMEKYEITHLQGYLGGWWGKREINYTPFHLLKFENNNKFL